MTFSPLNAIIDVDVAARFGLAVPAVTDAYLAGGARFIQIRAKALSGAAFLELSEEVVARARQAGALAIVNDRADIARLADAEGVHLGQDDLEPAAARRILGAGAIIGLSAHSIEQVRSACALPIDYLAVGPIFETATKATGHAPVGTALVSQARSALSVAGLHIPIVAIGGITLDSAQSVIRAGASSVAVISDLLATGNPEARVRDYLSALR